MSILSFALTSLTFVGLLAFIRPSRYTGERGYYYFCQICQNLKEGSLEILSRIKDIYYPIKYLQQGKERKRWCSSQFFHLSAKNIDL